MRALADLIFNQLVEGDPSESQRVVVADGYVGTYDPYVYLYPIWSVKTGKIVAIVQTGMLHEALVLFETGLTSILEAAGLEPVEYELSSTAEDNEDGVLPPEAAVFLRRMPGWFTTMSTIRVVPEQVFPHPWDETKEFSEQEFDFSHILGEVHRGLVRVREADWRTGNEAWGLSL